MGVSHSCIYGRLRLFSFPFTASAEERPMLFPPTPPNDAGKPSSGAGLKKYVTFVGPNSSYSPVKSIKITAMLVLEQIDYDVSKNHDISPIDTPSSIYSMMAVSPQRPFITLQVLMDPHLGSPETLKTESSQSPQIKRPRAKAGVGIAGHELHPAAVQQRKAGVSSLALRCSSRGLGSEPKVGPSALHVDIGEEWPHLRQTWPVM